MSLFFRRGQLEDAVAGNLAPEEEAELSGHLAGCARCRAHYDRLIHAARVLVGEPDQPTRTERRREEARLFGGKLSPARERPRRAFAPAVLGAALAMGLVAVVMSAPEPAPRVAWRGSGDIASKAGLVLWAKAPGEPVKLVGELPGSGEVRVSPNSQLQLFGWSKVAPAHVAVFAVAGGEVIRLPVSAQASEKPRPLGPSIDLARSSLRGKVRLIAIFSPQPIDEAAVDPNSLPGEQVSGLLMIED